MNKQECIDFFKSLNYSGFKNFYEKYKNYLLPERVDNTVIFPEAEKSIACFIVDCTEDNFNRGAYGSVEFVMEIVKNNENEIDIVCHEFRVTVDPCRNKEGIAHVARQIYRGNIGYHHSDQRRICIRSDINGTWYRRTDENGDYIEMNGHIVAEEKIGINNHDQGAYYDSSAGCIILFGGGWMKKDSPYVKDFKPLLENCSNEDNIPMSVISLNDMDDIIKS